MKPNIDEIEARANAATPGPWEQLDGEWYGEIKHQIVCDTRTVTFNVYKSLDAEFIAHARTDIPALLAYIRELEAERDAAVADMKEIAFTAGSCVNCKHDEQDPVCGCGLGFIGRDDDCWEWRGVK